MKRALTLILLAAMAISTMGYTTHCHASQKSNKNVAINYCKEYCKGYKIKIVKNVPKNRKSNKKIYIQRIKTKSIGNYTGITKDGHIVKYCKSIKKGKKEIVYLIYNPKNNACDDVICFVSNGRTRADNKKIK